MLGKLKPKTQNYPKNRIQNKNRTTLFEGLSKTPIMCSKRHLQDMGRGPRVNRKLMLMNDI